MANVAAVRPVKQTIDLGDGVEREVVFTLNAMAELEEKYGTIEAAFEKVQSGSVAAIRFLLWCILVPDGEDDMTEREVGKLIDISKLNDIMEAIMSAFESQMPESKEAPNVVTLARTQGKGW